jgi:ribosome modulation factor
MSKYAPFAEALKALADNQHGEHVSAQDEDEAYQQGEQAFRNGKSRSSNPYHASDEVTLHNAWNRGWDEMAEDEKREMTK